MGWGGSYIPTHRLCVECNCLTHGADYCWYCDADLTAANLVFATGFPGTTTDELLA
jgi:hypothetical protein